MGGATHTEGNRPMSAESKHKFDWMKAVRKDKRLTDGESRVLLFLAVVYVKNGVNTTYVGQQTITDRLGTSLRTVSRAYAKAISLRYLTLEVPRTGGRGHHEPDQYRLTIPETHATGGDHSDAETHATEDTHLIRNTRHHRQKTRQRQLVYQRKQ